LELRNKLVEQETKRILKSLGIDVNKFKKRKSQSAAEDSATKKAKTASASGKKLEQSPKLPSKTSGKPTAQGKAKSPKAPDTAAGADDETDNSNANGKAKATSSQGGSKRMCIPDDLFPGFCRRIGAFGCSERMKLASQFVEEHPAISHRQVTIRLAEITTKDIPACIPKPEKKLGRSFLFYLRPKFYSFLPPDERPDDWEKYAAEDEILYEKDQAEIRAGKKIDKRRKRPQSDQSASQSAASGDEDASSVVSSATSNSMAAGSIGDSNNEDLDGEETEDDDDGDGGRDEGDDGRRRRQGDEPRSKRPKY